MLAEAIRPVTLAKERLLPVLPALGDLLPGAGLRRGSVVSVSGAPGGGATSVALALLAAPSLAGSWAAAVALPDLGLVAAAELGVELDRLALVPDPGAQWPAVMAALLDGVELVLTRPPAHLRHGDARRVASRARERGAVVLSVGGQWPEGADVRLRVSAVGAPGLGHGHGRLEARAVEVSTSGRGAAARERHVRLWLPASDGSVRLCVDSARQSRETDAQSIAPAWAEVG